MTHITIPFNAWSVQKILDGKKNCTSRYRQLGQIGDTFSVKRNGESLEMRLTGFKSLTLEQVRNEYWADEGAESPEDFEKAWIKIYKQFTPERMVCVHFFKEVG